STNLTRDAQTARYFTPTRMLSDYQQEQACLYAAGALPVAEQEALEAELEQNTELREFVSTLRATMTSAALSVPHVSPPADLKQRTLNRIEARTRSPSAEVQASAAAGTKKVPGFKFVEANESKGWKQLPIPGAWIKFLSIEPAKGYAVLLGRLGAGVR